MAIKKVMLHVGFYKTGSTTLQNALIDASLPKGIEYLSLGPSCNHGEALISIFFENAHLHPFHLKLGLNEEQVEERGHRYRRDLVSFLEKARLDLLIISAEILAGASRTTMTRLRDTLLDHCHQIEVVAYVRPPISYLHSNFQHLIKSGRNNFDLIKYFPNYRNWIQILDDVFHRDRVTLLKYEKNSLKDQDICSDFSSRFGLGFHSIAKPHQNQSLSLEACSILYLQRKFGRGLISSPNFKSENQNFCDALEGLGDTPLRFSNGLLQDIHHRQKQHLSWVEERMGVSMKEALSEQTTTIGCEEDLLTLAESLCPKLLELLPNHSIDQNLPLLEQTLQAAEALYDLTRAMPPKRKRRRGKRKWLRLLKFWR